MTERYIAPEWLAAIRDTIFLYPAADLDHSEAIAVFQAHVETFWFCDINYPAGLELAPAIRESHQVRLVDQKKVGPVSASIERRTDARGREYRFLPPSKLIETYNRVDDGHLTVIRRRGFGQIALSAEFEDRSIGVFMHRGDSRGEGGSNAFFLANKEKCYEPCSNLYDKLSRRLADRALVISDGSNTSLKVLSRFYRAEMEGSDAYRYHQENGTNFTFGEFQWTCVGWLGKGYGPTLVWGLTRLAHHP